MAERVRCSGTLKDGRPCPYLAQKDSDVCGIHRRVKRLAVTKVVERGANKVAVYARVVSAAAAVASASSAIAVHWDKIVDTLSHFLNFLWADGRDRGASATLAQAEQVQRCATQLSNARTPGQLRDAAFGLEGAIDFFLLASSALDDERSPRAHGPAVSEVEFVKMQYEAISRAHRRFVEEIGAADPSLDEELANFYPRYRQGRSAEGSSVSG